MTHLLRSTVDGGVLGRALAGFELLSCVTPPRFRASAGSWEGTSSDFSGEPALAADVALALGPLVAGLPSDAALMVEYLFRPATHGRLDIRFRVLVQSQYLPAAQAAAQANTLVDRLALSLRVLCDWYAFVRCSFSPSDDLRWLGKRVRLQARARSITLSAGAPIGFRPTFDHAGVRQILLPEPSKEGGVERPVLLTGSRRCCLRQSLRAAIGMGIEVPVRIVLRRRSLDLSHLRAMLRLPRVLQSGEAASNDDAILSQGPAAAAVSDALELLATQTEGTDVLVEAVGTTEPVLAWLCLLGEEAFPKFEFVLEDGGRQRNADTEASPLDDLSHLLAAGCALPPLLPAPPELEALGFATHYQNPSVAVAEEGQLLGRAVIGGLEVDIRLPALDRNRHVHVVGATGSGKTTLVLNMAIQDLRNGSGLAVIDPHGDLHEQLLEVVPTERRADVIVLDPADERFCPSLNPLALGPTPDYFATCRVINDLLDLFAQWYDMRNAGGPGFEDYFRHGMLLAAAGPSGGPTDADGPEPTLASVAHVFRDRDWRTVCLARLNEAYGTLGAAQVGNFWRTAERISGEHDLTHWTPYVTSKLSRLAVNATLRRLFVTPGPRLDFRRLMDERKIVLVNLSKGQLGTADSRLVGSLLTKLFFRAAISRACVSREQRIPFYLYLDEFQNFMGADVPELLAESRKYGLSMVLAHQTLSQLVSADGNRSVLDAVSGNVGSRLYMRMGRTEANSVAADVAPHFDARTLIDLPDRHAIARLQLNGKPAAPFVLRTLPPLAPPAEAWRLRTSEWAAENLKALALQHSCEALNDQAPSHDEAARFAKGERIHV